MSAVEWVALVVGVWFVAGLVAAALVGPRLARASEQCPAPNEDEEP